MEVVLDCTMTSSLYLNVVILLIVVSVFYPNLSDLLDFIERWRFEIKLPTYLALDVNNLTFSVESGSVEAVDEAVKFVNFIVLFAAPLSPGCVPRGFERHYLKRSAISPALGLEVQIEVVPDL